MAAPSLTELRSLFAGVWIHDQGEWETSPCYHTTLALEIARRCDCRTPRALREWIYPGVPAGDVPQPAGHVIGAAVRQYNHERDETTAVPSPPGRNT